MRLALAILILAIILLAIGCVPIPAPADEIDMPLLRDTICEFETRGLEDRDFSEPGPFGEIGRCQVRISTARELGFTGNWTLLMIPHYNEVWAKAKLDKCAKRIWRFDDDEGTRTEVFGLAFAYNAGCRAKISKDHAAWGYAYQVRARYYSALFNRQKMLALAR